MGISLDRIVRADITRATRTASRRSFGLPLIAGYFPTSIFPERVRTYTDPADMITDGFGEDHPVYLDAVALVSQSPRVPRFKVGRRAGAPTQSINLVPSTPVAGEVYSLSIGGVTFAVTADATPDVGEICAAFELLINPDDDAIVATGASAVAAQELTESELDGAVGEGEISPPRNLTFTHNGNADWDATTGSIEGRDENGREIIETFSIPNGVGGGDQSVTLTKLFSFVTALNIPAQTGTNGTFTLGVGSTFSNANLAISATDNSTDFDIDADNAGDWYALEEVTANLSMNDETAEPATTLATDLAAIAAEDADWYGLLVADAQSAPQIEAIAAWAETQVVVYAADTFDSDVEDVTDADILSTLADAGYLRTFTMYRRANRHGAAALIGRVFPYDIGEADIEYEELVGQSADALSETAIERIVGPPESPVNSKRGGVYVEVLPAGTNVGTAITYGGMVAGGEWIDVIMGIDWTKARLQEKALNLRLSSPKVPFTAAGIDAFAGSVRAALLEAVERGILASFVVQATAIEDVSTEDKQARYYDGVRFDAVVEGAIRAFRIRGTVRP